MEIMNSLLRLGRRLASAGPSQQVNQPPAVPLAARAVNRVRAKPQHLAKWQEKNWSCRAGLLPGGVPAAEYSGFYQTRGGRKLRGLIVEAQRGITPYALDPPLEDIRKHTGHDVCFRRRDGMFFVHLTNPPRSVDEAILNIENLLNECEAKARWPKLATAPVVRVIAKAPRGVQ